MTEEKVTEERNETAFAELIQFLKDRSLTLIIREAGDEGLEMMVGKRGKC